MSPTLGAQIQAVSKKYPGAKWHQYDPAGPHTARAAASMVFGRPVNTYYNFDRGGRRAFARFRFPGKRTRLDSIRARFRRSATARRPPGHEPPLCIESTMTATGGKADHRFGDAVRGR